MNKKTIISLISTIVAIVTIVLIKFIQYRTQATRLNNIDKNMIEVSKYDGNEPVTDNCIDEWEDYQKYVSERIEEVSSIPVEDISHYKLKDVDGYINVYYIENEDEYLYKRTNISTEYLSEEDIKILNEGIEVIGSEELNRKLEDFE